MRLLPGKTRDQRVVVFTTRNGGERVVAMKRWQAHAGMSRHLDRVKPDKCWGSRTSDG